VGRNLHNADLPGLHRLEELVQDEGNSLLHRIAVRRSISRNPTTTPIPNFIAFATRWNS
jgi:hypothetical protein